MNKLLILVNAARIIFDVPPVVYDYDLHTYLADLNMSNVYEFTDVPYMVFDGPDGQRINNLVGSSLKPLANTYMFRDTIKEADDILKIFRLRIGQEKCFNYKLCSPYIFNNYVSCLRNPRDSFENMKKCSWANSYWPYIVNPTLTSFACRVLDIQGRYVPTKLKNRQFKSFWCYGNFSLPNNDLMH